MTDKKISQLTNASTPLAGTEVLPIVQSSTTVKVATNDLTVKNVRSNATTGILQIAGPATAATRTMTVPDANFTVARTDAANSFTSDQTLADGNLVVGTAAKGINFSANTHAAGMTSELLNWYEDGAWTPVPADAASGGNTGTVGSSYGAYTRVGRMVYVTGAVVNVNTTGMTAGNVFYIQGLPFASYNIPSSTGFYLSGGVATSNVTIASPVQSQVQDTQSAVSFFDSGGAIIVSDVSSGPGDIYFSFSYLAA